MKKWIQKHLKVAAEKKIAASKEENVLLADVIEVLSLLTKFGYYDSLNDIRDLLQYLLEILNGFTDLCDPNKGKYLACLRPNISIQHTVHMKFFARRNFLLISPLGINFRYKEITTAFRC